MGKDESASVEKADRTWIKEIASEVLLFLLESCPQRQVTKHLVASKHHPTTAKPPAKFAVALVRGGISEEEEL